jgi:predicted transcriptional regulator
MTTIIFNTDAKLKRAALKKARAQGLTLTTVLNLATRKYVADELVVDVIARDLAEARKGKAIPAEEVYKKFGIKR